MKDNPTENQKRVVEKTCEKLRKGELVNKGKILKEVGYSKRTSEHPKKIYESDGVKGGLEPIVNRMINERDRLLTEAQTRELSDIRYEEIMRATDILTKNIQLLSGKATERNENVLTDEQINELINRRAKTNNASGETSLN
jgi:hypothetical protein